MMPPEKVGADYACNVISPKKTTPLEESRTENNQTHRDLQVRKLRRLFFLSADTAVTVASLAWRCAR
jgi:hypothetical protein